MNKNWYVLYVKTGKEEKLKDKLNSITNNEITFHVPKRVLRERRKGKIRNVLKPLFQGYILIEGELNELNYHNIKTADGAFYFLKDNEGLLHLDSSEIEVLSKLMNNSNGDTIGNSEIYMEGDSIYVMNGALYAMEGYIVSVNKRKCRAKVRLNVAGNEKIVELAISLIKKS